MRIAAVTAVRNGQEHIAETIQSIVNQRALLEGRVELDYLVWDGASSDATATRAADALGTRGRLVSRSDTGMYDAIGQALTEVDGDVYFYLNAGDLLQPGCFDFLLRAFTDTDDRYRWLCGLHVHYSRQGDIVGARRPFRYRQRMIQRGYYGRGLPTIQQESTFWSRELMSTIDLDTFRRFKLAGDFYLWHEFARRSEPYVASIALGGFRYHGDHLSADRAGYRAELDEIAGRLNLSDRIAIQMERLLWHTPHRLRGGLLGPEIDATTGAPA